jgi:hypothetical protein
MSMTVTYTTFNGQIISENRDGVIRDYVPDADGNTVALADETGSIADSWTYWPYGEVQNHTGPSGTPFTYLGTLGMSSDSARQGYARARSVRFDLARWMTVDGMWPIEPAYIYALSNPETYVDATGEAPTRPGTGPGGCPGQDALNKITNLLHTHPKCLKDYQGLCNGQSLTKVISQVTFTVRPICSKSVPKRPACTHAHLLPGPAGPGASNCVPDDICFTQRLCGMGVNQRALDLLFELGNWCNCKNHSLDGGEGPAKQMCIDCGFPASKCNGSGINRL